MERTEETQAGDQFTMKDKEFLTWLHDRLVCVYHEDPNTDFVRKLKFVTDRIPKDQDTCSGMMISIDDKIAAFRTTYALGDSRGVHLHSLIEILDAINQRLNVIERKMKG